MDLTHHPNTIIFSYGCVIRFKGRHHNGLSAAYQSSSSILSIRCPPTTSSMSTTAPAWGLLKLLRLEHTNAPVWLDNMLLFIFMCHIHFLFAYDWEGQNVSVRIGRRWKGREAVAVITTPALCGKPSACFQRCCTWPFRHHKTFTFWK